MSTFRSFPFFLLSTALLVRAQTADPAASAGDGSAGSAPVRLEKFVVSDQLDRAREDIVPSLGATSFVIDRGQIEAMPLGADASFSQVLLRAPGVAQDSSGSGGIHVRGEHANLQFRINDVLLPEGISGFGLEIDPRFVDTMQLVTGSLPAQYGFRTAGVVDIHTKRGTDAPSGEIGLFGGSQGTLRPSFELAGASGRMSYFVDGSYDRNELGIENPTSAAGALHDATDQKKAFGSFSYVIDDSSRVSVMGSVSVSDFQVPNTPGLEPGTSPDGKPWLPGDFDSTKLDENQREQNAYAVVAYQKSAGELNYQAAVFGRSSEVHFTPDPIGDLFFNGVASDVKRTIASGGAQIDASRIVGSVHTLRAGLMVLDEVLHADTTTTVFPVDADGNPTGPAYPIAGADREHAAFYGAYVQDEWRLAAPLTLNFGARFDVFSSGFDDESQLSPRVNLIYRASEATTFHAGYARYFTPPPLENVPASTIARFDGTSNASASGRNDPIRSERADYFDLGVSQQLLPGLQVGLDGYYKHAREQLDDGLFGQTLILSAFNYDEGRIYGLEFSGSYTRGGFSTYLNLARSLAKGRGWNSAQFQFDPADLAYVQSHWIYLDHDQQLSGSFGASYDWKHAGGDTKVFVDFIHGSGLRNDATDDLGNTIPNGGAVPSYDTLSIGAGQTIALGGGRELRLRLDVVNLTDENYELRDGSGVGVNAAQYGARRGIFGSVGYAF